MKNHLDIDEDILEALVCKNNLQTACFYGNFDKLKKIIDSDNYDKDQDPKLIPLAANYDHVDIVTYLIRKGFDPNESHAILFSGNSALMLFIENHNINGVIALLRANCNIEHKNLNGETALLLAVKFGYTKIVKELIEHGADINVLNNHKYSPLLVAISIKNRDITRLLIYYGADVNLTTNDLNNKPIAPLDYAHNTLSIKINGKHKIHENYIDIIKDLLRAGAKTRYNIDHNLSGNKRSSSELNR